MIKQALILCLTGIGLFIVAGLMLMGTIMLADMVAEREDMPVVTHAEVKEIFKKLQTAAGGEALYLVLVIELSDKVNAYAGTDDDTTELPMQEWRYGVIVTTGMLDYIESEEEIAAILGHEIAHHMLGHTSLEAPGSDTDYVDTFLDSRLVEANADRVGQQLAQQAGYGQCGASDFWSRILEEDGDDYGNSHPSNASRAHLAVALCDL